MKNAGSGSDGSFWVPGYGSCVVTAKGYPRIRSGPLRGQYMHRAVWERTAGRKLPGDWEVHHMASKMDWEPHCLVALERCLHVGTKPRRDPYTGEFMSEEQYQDRYFSTLVKDRG